MSSLMSFEKHHGFAAIDNAVVVGQGEVHHRTDHNLSLDGHRTIFDRMKSEHTALRRIHDRRGKHRPVDAAIADGKCAALKFVDLELVLLRAFGKIGDGLLDFRKAHVFGIAQNGNDQSLATADGDTDVVVVAIDDVGATNLRIDLRNQLEGFDRMPSRRTT